MISVESLLYRLEQKVNKLSTNEHQSVPIEDRLLILNEAQNRAILSRMSPEDTKLGFESFLKRYQDLEVLVQPWKEITLQQANAQLHQFSGPLQDDFMFFIDAYVLASKGPCTGRILHTTLIKHKDLKILRKHPHYFPSFEYEDTLVTISSGALEVYSDGSFTPTVANVSYLRYPAKIDYAGYTHLDGTPSTTQDCELPQYMEDEMLQIAEALLLKPLTQDTK